MVVMKSHRPPRVGSIPGDRRQRLVTPPARTGLWTFRAGAEVWRKARFAWSDDFRKKLHLSAASASLQGGRSREC